MGQKSERRTPSSLTSMYPIIMSDKKYYYPIKTTIIYTRGRDNFPSLSDIFHLISCRILRPDLYFPVLPEHKTNKVLFHLDPMEGTWTAFEVQKAVQLGYVIGCMYKVHHYEHKSCSLFCAYSETFFKIKQRATVDGNKGLEALAIGLEVVAKMCINGPTGKWGSIWPNKWVCIWWQKQQIF